MTDTERIDRLENLLRGRLDDGCDITLRGLRQTPAHEASAYEISFTHAKLETKTALSLRKAIDCALEPDDVTNEPDK